MSDQSTSQKLQRHIFARTGILTKEDIEGMLDLAFEDLQDMYPDEKFVKGYVVNIMCKKDVLLGYGYIWVEDFGFYNALVGLNIDGSERIEEKPDPNWKPPAIPLEEALEEAKGSWAGIDEIEERYKQPIIQTKLEPLDILPGRYLNKKQLSDLKKILVNAHVFECENCQASHLQQFENIDPHYTIECFPAVNSIYTDMTNELYIHNLPDSITEEDLVKFFSRFENDLEVHHQKNEKVKYPRVNIVVNKHNHHQKQEYNRSEDDGDWRVSTAKKKHPTRRAYIKFSPRIGYEAAFMTKLMKNFVLKGELIWVSLKKSK